MSVFAHLLGLARPAAAAPKSKGEAAPKPKTKAEGADVTAEDVEDVKEELEEAKDDLEEVEEKVEDLEDAVEEQDDAADDTGPDPAEKPAEAKAFRAGRKAGAKAERARCSAIFQAKEAGKNPALAASLAFETMLPVKQAVALLKSGALTAPAPAPRRGLDDRMDRRPSPALGAGGGAGPDRNTAAGNAAFILAAGRKTAAK